MTTDCKDGKPIATLNVLDAKTLQPRVLVFNNHTDRDLLARISEVNRNLDIVPLLQESKPIALQDALLSSGILDMEPPLLPEPASFVAPKATDDNITIDTGYSYPSFFGVKGGFRRNPRPAPEDRKEKRKQRKKAQRRNRR